MAQAAVGQKRGPPRKCDVGLWWPFLAEARDQSGERSARWGGYDAMEEVVPKLRDPADDLGLTRT